MDQDLHLIQVNTPKYDEIIEEEIDIAFVEDGTPVGISTVLRNKYKYEDEKHLAKNKIINGLLNGLLNKRKKSFPKLDK